MANRIHDIALLMDETALAGCRGKQGSNGSKQSIVTIRKNQIDLLDTTVYEDLEAHTSSRPYSHLAQARPGRESLCFLPNRPPMPLKSSWNPLDPHDALAPMDSVEVQDAPMGLQCACTPLLKLFS